MPEDGTSKTLAGLARRGGDTGHPAWGRVEGDTGELTIELTADARIQSIITGAGCWALCRLECGGHVKYLAVVTGARCDFIGHVLLSPASIFRLSFVIRLTLGLFLLSHHRLLACSAPQPHHYEHLELTGKSHNTAGHVLQVHVSPVQRVTTHNTPQPDQVTPS